MSILKSTGIVMLALLLFNGSLAYAASLQEGTYKINKGYFIDQTKNTVVLLEIEFAEHWKWNDRYPFKYDIKVPKGAQLYKKDISFMNSEGRNITVIAFGLKDVSYKPKMQFSVVLTFGYCNNITCKVEKNKEIIIKEKINLALINPNEKQTK